MKKLVWLYNQAMEWALFIAFALGLHMLHPGLPLVVIGGTLWLIKLKANTERKDTP